MTTVSCGARSTGRTTMRSSATPPTNAISTANANASSMGIPVCVSCHAMYVVNIASSPCAKLMMPIAR